MKCPECQEKDFKSKGWFVRHMGFVHDWSKEKAREWWDTRCPQCGAPIVNEQFCLACKYPFKKEVKKEV